MSVFEPDQLIASQKSNAATLFALTNLAFESFQRLVELNLQTVRSALAKSETYWQEALSVKTPEEYITRQTNLLQPAAGQALSYSGQLYDIVSNTQAEWTTVTQAQYAHLNRAARTLGDKLVQNAPAGTEVANTALKSDFPTSMNAGETVRKAAKQAIEAAKGTRTANR
ncbi:phasin family protein [Paraburkholderia fungorum]|uniref:phasin family protein n=1 Tax=Paraburkholderia fungorum TaxID=134537 RepID=UPI0038BBDA69